MNADRWSSLFWFALGAAGIYASARLGVGRTGEPGSGFVPLTASAFVCLMALLVFLQSFGRGHARGLSTLWKNVYWRRSLAVGVLTLAYILVLETAGFFLTGFVLLVATMKGLEGLSWRKTLTISIITLVVSYVVFKVLLKATLPMGFLDF